MHSSLQNVIRSVRRLNRYIKPLIISLKSCKRREMIRSRTATKILFGVIVIYCVIKAYNLVYKRRLRRSNDLMQTVGKTRDSLTKYAKDLRKIAVEYELQRMQKVLDKEKDNKMKKSNRKVKKKPKTKEDHSRMAKSEEWWNKGITNNFRKTLEEILKRDYDSGSRCAVGYYRLQGMKECNPWLTCNEIENTTLLTKTKFIEGGIGKTVSAGILNGKYEVAIVRNRPKAWFKKRVQIGNRNIVAMQPSPYAVQVVGVCEIKKDSIVVTESCKKYGDLGKFVRSKKFATLKQTERFKLAIQIVGSFNFLHHDFALPRVHCDLHTLNETFDQYVVSDDLRVFMADVDEIPEVDKKNSKYPNCSEESHGIMKEPEFIAPEQRYTHEEFRKGISKKPLDEKSNIWQIPYITKALVSEKKILNKLHDVHKRCTNIDPSKRPTATEVLIRYLQVLQRVS